MSKIKDPKGRRQIDIVLKAYVEGSRTSWDVWEETGLRRKSCATYANMLAKKGYLRLVGIDPSWDITKQGRRPLFYEPTTKGYKEGARL